MQWIEFQRFTELITILPYGSSLTTSIWGTLLSKKVVSNNINRVSLNWSDHSILELSLHLRASPLGPELWRAIPAYASHEKLQLQLSCHLTRVFQRLQSE